jgi:hypothetical protein
MQMMKKKATKEQVIEAASVLRDLDYAVMQGVTRIDGMTLSAAGELVDIHRRLRRMRYEIEAAGGVELARCVMRNQPTHPIKRTEQ